MLSSPGAPRPVEIHLNELLADPSRYDGQPLAVRGFIWTLECGAAGLRRFVLGGPEPQNRLSCWVHKVLPSADDGPGEGVIVTGVLRVMDEVPVLEDGTVRRAP